MDPVQVLIIDDDEDDFVLSRDLLGEIEGTRYEATWKSRPEEGLKELLRPAYGVCLLDYRLGASTGLDVLRQAVAEHAPVPIILLTGQSEREIDLEAMRQGAADYLIKGQITPALLERSIRYAMERHRQIQERDTLITELKDALSHIKVLHGLIPICASCKKVRDDKGYWSQVEQYIEKNSAATFSHGICPACMEKLYPEFVKPVEEQGTRDA